VASAPLDDLFKAWEGLGYYSRVRNIKKAAVSLAENGGRIPSSPEDLRKIPGIGPYTAGAVASFAFRQKAPAVDGNVARVISRYYALEGDVQKKILEEKTLSFLPDSEPWIVMEGLIELGAVFCGRSPRCDRCPLAAGCRARIEGKTATIPPPKKRPSTIRVERSVWVLVAGDEVLLERKKEGAVLGGLTEFPSVLFSSEEDLEREIEKVYEI
jgi:A/G-specific adenine glycosylase